MIIGHYIFKFSVALCWRLPWLAGALRVKLRLGVCVHPLPSHYIMVLLQMKRTQQTEPGVSGKVREHHATLISLKPFNASLMAGSNPGRVGRDE